MLMYHQGWHLVLLVGAGLVVEAALPQMLQHLVAAILCAQCLNAYTWEDVALGKMQCESISK